jgi:hypothetical protein
MVAFLLWLPGYLRAKIDARGGHFNPHSVAWTNSISVCNYGSFCHIGPRKAPETGNEAGRAHSGRMQE